MPKSYLADEPGAQRAASNQFDPFAQTWNRLLALFNIGHPVEKIEVIVLGGTWSSYTLNYQRYFITQIFDACNHFGQALDAHLTLGGPPPQPKESREDHPLSDISPDLLQETPTLDEAYHAYNKAINHALRTRQQGSLNLPHEMAEWTDVDHVHRANVNARCKVVGLAVETRPDEINAREIENLRRLGATKIQLGVQSLNDEVLQANRRGHSVAQARRASSALRSAGFKLHMHWMANLYGSNVAEDCADYQRLFTDPEMCPDELKLYPCSLIPKTPLMSLYKQGDWRPYDRGELLELLIDVMPNTPEYCRLTRVIRDIPSTDIHVGNQETNFREVAEAELDRRGIKLREIRSREVRGNATSSGAPRLRTVSYQTQVSIEYFINIEDSESGNLLGFCRLSLPHKHDVSPQETYLSAQMSDELEGCALLREVHVYGQSLKISEVSKPAAQHRGFGKKLVRHAASIAEAEEYKQLAVISAIGTRGYYEKLGFHLGVFYQHLPLNS
jgi:elongator complex protein 3